MPGSTSGSEPKKLVKSATEWFVGLDVARGIGAEPLTGLVSVGPADRQHQQAAGGQRGDLARHQVAHRRSGEEVQQRPMSKQTGLVRSMPARTDGLQDHRRLPYVTLDHGHAWAAGGRQGPAAARGPPRR